MGKSSAPAATNPVTTAEASTGTNIGTAIANANLNHVNQTGPDGSISYAQTGSSTYTDPYTKQSYEIPQYTQTTSYSPTQQALYDSSNSTKQNLSNVANSLSSKLGNTLSTPFNGDNKAVEDKIDSLGAARLDPQYARSQDALSTSLANQGIQPGSAAWNAQMTQFSQGKNDAYNQLYLNGNQQAYNQALSTRNQQTNEISALQSGSQVTNPTFAATTQTTIPTTDTAGIINTSYNQAQNKYQSQNNQWNSIAGGLFKLGSSAITASDRRLKKNIKKIGKTDDGQSLYSYKYKGTNEHRIGLMAQDVEKKNPDAVTTMPSGYKGVDYSKALGLKDVK